MKNMRLSVRLFLSFGAILLLLIVIVGMEFNTIKQLTSSKDRLENATAINDNIQIANQWTQDYYQTFAVSSANRVDQSYIITREKLDAGGKIFSNQEDLQAISDMKGQLDDYLKTFGEYKACVKNNDESFEKMASSVDKTVTELEKIMKVQKQDFSYFINKTSGLTNDDEIDVVSLSEQMNSEYIEVATAYDTVISMQKVMVGQLKFLLLKDEEFDSQVSWNVDRLRNQCNWLYDNFERQSNKLSIEVVRAYIDTYVKNYDEYKQVIKDQNEKKAKLDNIVFSISKKAAALAESQKKSMATDMSVAIKFSLAFGIASIIIAIVLAVLITRRLVKSLTENMNKLSQSAQLVSNASSQLAGASQQLSEGSTEQAASIEETSATMEETLSMIKRTAENTHQANSISKEASIAASAGSEKMFDMIASMEELKKSSNEISKIIKVIDQIALQTNMLALNAAVEAARAGEEGLGFAVVATEVRNLAQKSAEAARNTANIIKKNIELSEEGVAISDSVSVALKEIISKTQDVNQIIEEISVASEEQARGAVQVTEAVAQMETIVQSNAATAEESAASSEELQVQAKALENVVVQLNKLVKGKETDNEEKGKKGKGIRRKLKKAKDNIDVDKMKTSAKKSFGSLIKKLGKRNKK